MDAAIPLRLLADVTKAITAGGGWEGSLRRLAELLVEELADWCVVDLLDERGQARRVVVVGRASGPDSPHPGEASNLLPAWPEISTAPLAQALRRRAAVLISDVPPPEQAADPLEFAQLELLARLGARTAIAAPLDVGGRTFGVIIVTRTGADRPFIQAQVPLIENIARQGALVVENARLYGQQREIATYLQRSLLPESLPALPPLHLIARYTPARTHAEVGGDWYDALVLPDGTLAFTIGDVIGHDLRATARMSQLQHMLRALALDRPGPPDDVVRRLDQALENLHEPDVMATLIFGVARTLDADTAVLAWSNAGHPPPLLIPADGQARFVPGGHGLPIGVDANVSRERAASVTIAAGGLFLLYTDGLIERPGEDLSLGLERLGRAATDLYGLPPDRFLDELTELLAPTRGDDVALLALYNSATSPRHH